MSYDTNCHLWPSKEDNFFKNMEIKPIRQKRKSSA